MNGAPILTVVVADHHEPFREGIRLALEDQGFAIVAEAHSAREALEAVVRERPDICLVEAHLPGNGITAVRRISASVPTTAVVLLTVSDDSADVFAALRAGAVGCLLKTMEPGRLPHALRGVANGEAALTRQLTAQLIEEFRGRAARRRDLPVIRRRQVFLTNREWDVADLLCAELTTAQIAGRLGLAEVTVRRHISQIVHKLEAEDRGAALALLTATGSHS